MRFLSDSPQTTSRLVIALVAALAALGTGIVIAETTAAGPKFSLAMAPDSQSLHQGDAATFDIRITRATGFTDPVLLTVSGLPAGATSSFPAVSEVQGATFTNKPDRKKIRKALARCVKKANKRKTLAKRKKARSKCRTAARRALKPKPVAKASQVVARSSQATPTNTLTVHANAAPGTYSFTVTGKGVLSNDAVKVKGTLVILPPLDGPDFGIALSPATQEIVQSDDATYTAWVGRTGGFTGPVTVTTLMTPPKSTATFGTSEVTGAGTTLHLVTSHDTPPDAHQIWLQGSAVINGKTVTRLAVANVAVKENKPFTIEGDVLGEMGPGGAEHPLDLELTNPQKFSLAIRSVTAAIAPETDKPGCNGNENFAARQMPDAVFPLVIPAGETRRLSELGVAESQRPKVRMVSLDSNQDACLGARIQLRYWGTATKP